MKDITIILLQKFDTDFKKPDERREFYWLGFYE